MADIASFLATRIEASGHTINVPLVEAAGLLHDLDKAFPAEHPLKWLGHGEAGAEWARQNGHAQIAAALANHPVMRLADDEHYLPWVHGATVEERVVAYADKRTKQDLVTLDERFVEWLARHGQTRGMEVARERAEALERDVCGAATIAPEDVQRAQWAVHALARADGQATTPTPEQE
ncbi:MAG: HD domain-containing protein [Candidatus Limnocylindrales bacterium]